MTRIRLAAIVILSLGLAGTFAVSAVVGQLGRIPHVHAPDQLVHVVETGARGDALAVPSGLLGRWNGHARSIVAAAGYNARVRDMLMVSGDRAAIVRIVLATRNFFDVLGVVPARGTTGEVGLVLSHDFWVGHFDGDPGVVGRAVALEGVMGWRVLAIAPPGFHFPARTDVWELSFDAEAFDHDMKSRFFHVLARKRPGSSDSHVTSELAAIAATLPSADPPASGVRVTPATRLLGGRLRSPLLLLSVYSAAFLLVAIAGTIHLESMRRLASASALSIRLALGATMATLSGDAIRQSIVTVGTAVAVALPLGAWILTLLVRLVPQLPASGSLADTAWPLAIGLMVCPIVAVSAAAVWQTRDLLISAPSLLANQTHTATPGAASAWMQKLMIVVSLAGATGVAIHTVSAARHHARELLPALGWDASRVLAADVAYPIIARGHRDGYHPYDRYLSTTQALVDRVAALPGLMSVSTVEAAPFAPGFRSGRVRRPEVTDAEGVDVAYEVIGPGFFATLGITPRVGRELTSEDRLPASVVLNSRAPRGPGHIIVGRRLARQLWGDANPIGERVLVDETFFTTRRVVGVVDDVRLRPVGVVERPVVYVPYLEEPTPRLALLMRLAPGQRPSGRAVRDALIAAGQDAALGAVELAAEANRRATAPIRTVVALYATVAAMTIAICVLTVYATIAYAVRVRRREWAVRLALGGREAALIGRLTTAGLSLAAAGIALGGVSAWATSAVVRAALESSTVAALDIVAGSVVVLVAAVLSCGAAAAAIRETNLVTLLRS